MDQIVAKTIAGIAETLSANHITPPDQQGWTQEEQDWYNRFNISHSQGLPPQLKTTQCHHNWKLRGEKMEINKWILTQNRPLLFFDGASKNNPGIAGAGGLIKDNKGTLISRYEWGLGNTSNNAAEAYSLFLGTEILHRLDMRNAMIIGDSAIIIASMITGKEFTKASLNSIRMRINDNIRNLGQVTFMHVLRESNAEADILANRAVKRPQGQVCENGRVFEKAIP